MQPPSVEARRVVRLAPLHQRVVVLVLLEHFCPHVFEKLGRRMKYEGKCIRKQVVVDMNILAEIPYIAYSEP